MQWQDEAIIVSVKPFSEKEAVVEVFARDHGVYRAVAKNALTSKQRGTYQLGNLVFCRWNARLAEQMGTIACELLEPNAAFAMQSQVTLTALNMIAALLDMGLHERDAHPLLYDRVKSAIQAISTGDQWEYEYLLFEYDLLRECGFGLDLSECAATGSKTDLIYVSPKSGRAVSEGAGEPYKDKLFVLPACLKSQKTLPKPAEILDGLRITGYFIQEWLLHAQEYTMPPARGRLIEMLELWKKQSVAA